jgi:large subunit ribosomal protein L24
MSNSTQRVHKLKIRKGDQVIVLTGKDKGKRGSVLQVLRGAKTKRGATTKVVVEGANLIKKTMRGNPNTGTEGGIVTREAGLPISNVALLNPVTQKADKVGYKQLEDGRKVRYFKSNGELVQA